MDVWWGFNNVWIKPSDCHKAAFITPWGLFEPTVMFFGLINSPTTFQTMMNMILKPLIDQGVIQVYIDDILVYTSTHKENIAVMQETLQILEEHSLYLKREKCKFFMDELTYLGVVISGSGVCMDPEKVSAILDWPIPLLKTQVQCFLGICNFYQKFIKDFSKIAHPLHDLTKKSDNWAWNLKANGAFIALKQLLTTAPILCFPSNTDPY
jgi:hypothetical protein